MLSHSQVCIQVPITDVYGPTAWDADLQCLVVTTDTARGGDKVNEERKRKVCYKFANFDCVIHTSMAGIVPSGYSYGRAGGVKG